MWKEIGRRRSRGTPRGCNRSGEHLRERERAQERDKDRIVREYRGMLLEREGFDGNKLRS